MFYNKNLLLCTVNYSHQNVFKSLLSNIYKSLRNDGFQIFVFKIFNRTVKITIIFTERKQSCYPSTPFNSLQVL